MLYVAQVTSVHSESLAKPQNCTQRVFHELDREFHSFNDVTNMHSILIFIMNKYYDKIVDVDVFLKVQV